MDSRSAQRGILWSICLDVQKVWDPLYGRLILEVPKLERPSSLEQLSKHTTFRRLSKGSFQFRGIDRDGVEIAASSLYSYAAMLESQRSSTECAQKPKKHRETRSQKHHNSQTVGTQLMQGRFRADITQEGPGTL